MDALQIYRNSSVEWNPSPVVALATSLDASQVAAARADGSLEIWLVSPGSVGWHCQLTIQGNPDSRVSSLAWCPVASKSTAAPTGRLFSSSIDGSVSEWDLFSLKQKVVLESIGVSIWQMAVEPCDDSNAEANGLSKHKDENEDEENEEDEEEEHAFGLNSVERGRGDSRCVALGCDDGSVRLYIVSDSDGLTYIRSSLRVSGRILSVAWSLDAKLIFSGTSDGFIRCWDARLSHELYRITVGVGGLGSGPEICIWSLLVLRCGTLVSGDSMGSVQFWDSCHGTLLMGHSYHKGDVNALATVPSNNRVFSAGSDGQIILYKLASDAPESGMDMSSAEVPKKWVYVGYVRAHTHDIRALTVAVPIIREDELPKGMPRPRQRLKPVDFTYHKWAHLGVPMLISAGDDSKLFAYSAKEFTQFAPHDICPAPQRPPIQLVCDAAVDGSSMVLVQCSNSLGLFLVHLHGEATLDMSSKRTAITRLLARVKSKASRKIICSAISSSGLLFAFSDHVKPSLFELILEAGQSRWAIVKRQLPRRLPFAHAMVFTSDSSCLIVAGHDRKINVVGLESAELLHTFVPTRRDNDMNSPPREPPITRMFTSSDGQWLAAVNCFGDVYIFNLELRRQHWFISRLDGASVTAGGFHPRNSNILVITTSSNRIYVFDVDAKQLGEWSRRHTPVLPRRFQEFPGEVIGISFPPSKSSTSVIVYSARAMCKIDFGMPVCLDEDLPNGSGHQSKEASNFSKAILKRKHKELDQKLMLNVNKNFNFRSFNDPVLFLGHLSENSVLIIDKPWLEVARTFDAPVHRHVFGS